MRYISSRVIRFSMPSELRTPKVIGRKRKRELQEDNEVDSALHAIIIPNTDFYRYFDCNKDVFTTEVSDICD